MRSAAVSPIRFTRTILTHRKTSRSSTRRRRRRSLGPRGEDTRGVPPIAPFVAAQRQRRGQTVELLVQPALSRAADRDRPAARRQPTASA
jgi:hypothetical protein